jgi:hypothetical protein
MGRPLRVLLVLLFLDLVAGSPGLGIETRTESPAFIGALWIIDFLLVFAAFGLSWRWPVLASRFAVAAGALTAILAALDLVGLLDPVRPGTAMTIVDLAAVAIGIAIMWLGARRAGPSGAV